MAYIGREPQIGNFQVCDAITVVDAQAAYTMQVSSVDVFPETANHMLVSLNGILQAPTTSYTVAGSTITFASALETGDVIDFIQILGNVLDLGVPSDNTVTTAKLSDSSVTTAKLNDASVSLAKLTATGTKDATTFLRGDNTFASPSSDYVLLTTTTASNVASFAVNGFFTSDYDVYKIFLYNVYAGSNDQDLRMRVNTTGSYTEQTATSNYFYAFTRLNGTTSSTTNREDAAQYQSQSGMACGRISNDSSKMSNTEITFFKPTDASNYKIFQSQFGGWNSTTAICTGTSTGVYLNTTAVTGLTFLSQAGNIWCEKLYLYGLKNS
jgi:hypothetical protein